MYDPASFEYFLRRHLVDDGDTKHVWLHNAQESNIPTCHKATKGGIAGTAQLAIFDKIEVDSALLNPVALSRQY